MSWLILLFLAPLKAWAQEVNFFGATSGAERRPERELMRTQNQEQIMNRLRQRALQEIERRIQSLNKLRERLQTFKKLSETQKTSLINQVEAEIEKLQDLKNKINADTDLATLKTDSQSIIKAYRIYALFIPKIHLLAASDTALDLLETKIKDTIAKLQSKLEEAKTAGKDVKSLEDALLTIQNKIANLKSQIQSLQASLMALTPEGYPDNKTTLQNARATLQTIHKEIQALRQELKRIIQELRDLRLQASPKASPSLPANFSPSPISTFSATPSPAL